MTTSFDPGRRFPCFVDVCNDAVQFCSFKQRHCRYCSDFTQHCFTNQQQQNCTRYCMEKWVELNSDENVETDCSEWTATAIVGVTLLVILMSINSCYIVAKFCCKNKLRRLLEVFKCGLCIGAPSNTQPIPCTVCAAVNNGRAIEQQNRGQGEGTDEPLLNRSQQSIETGGHPATTHVSVYTNNSHNGENVPNSIQQNNNNISRQRHNSDINPVGGRRREDAHQRRNQPSSMPVNVMNDTARPEPSFVTSSTNQNAMPYFDSATDTGYATAVSNVDTTHPKLPHEHDDNRHLNLTHEDNDTQINDVEHETDNGRTPIPNQSDDPEKLTLSDFSEK